MPSNLFADSNAGTPPAAAAAGGSSNLVDLDDFDAVLATATAQLGATTAATTTATNPAAGSLTGDDELDELLKD